ncbi:hypothetical protein ACE02G_10520 [Shewanella xiamenensis]|uniref:hypothetical protein n=1 Tax=Shewanella xiamenensis TaxID=332186 RepID=UPI0035B7EFB7
MNFENRIKGNITETIVKALLVDEGYRVIDSGIEHIIREVSCLGRQEYFGLSFANALRKLPDLVVMNKDQTKSHLVEVKYRQSWNSNLINDLREQVTFFNEIVLICVNGSPDTTSLAVSGATHLRAIELKYQDDKYLANKYFSNSPGKRGEFEWISITDGSEIDWWNLAPLQFVFNEMTSAAHPEDHPKYGTNINTLLACRAIKSLMDKTIWNVDE